MTAEPVDLRLTLGALAGWLAVYACLLRTAGVVLAAGAGAALTAVVLVCAARHLRAAAALALMLFCVALVLLPLAARLAEARASPLLALARRHASVVLTLTVRADPVPLAAAGLDGSPRVLVEAAADSVTVRGGSLPVDGAVLVLADGAGWQDVLPGQLARLAGSLAPDLDGSALSVTLFARGPPELVGAPPWWQRAAGRVRAGLRAAAAVLPDQERGLLPGLVDGDTSGLDPVLAERFRLAGLTHLVAVSGTNCSIVVGAVLLLLRRLRVRPWACALAGALTLAMFVVVARPSPSVLRAAVMALIALLALSSGRPRAGVPALAAAVLGLLLWQPTIASTPSFAMSVLATGALLLIAPGWAVALRRRRVPAGLAEAFAVAAAAHVVTAPVVAAISGRISLVAVLANVLAEPVVAPITVLGFLAAAIAPVWLGGALPLVWLAGWPCRWLVLVADYFGGLSGAALPWPGGAPGGILLAATGLVIAVAAARAGAGRVLGAAAVTAFVILVPVRAATSSWPPADWLFAACDVGQGDALLLHAGPGAAVAVDAGPDPVLVDRCLRDLGVTRIPLLVLTHYHLDHVGGLSGLGRGRPVGQVVSGPLADPAAGVAIVGRFTAPRALSVSSPPPGTRLTAGAVQLEVLGPRRWYRGTRSDPNNSSLVLLAEVGGVRILLPGDAEIEAQQDLVGAGVDLRADVLKVPHHGSAYFDADFLAAVHAQVAVVSVGAGNDYGHPSPLLLTELARLGVPLFRTDRVGDVAVRGTRDRLSVVVHGRLPAGLGLGGDLPAPRTADLAVSRAGAWIATCRPARSLSTICPSRFHPSSCSSATRTCSSTAPSARSPPPRGAPTRRSPRPT
ncbi:MAG: competence protein ComEC [Pseudonocardiales bacterium]|nr:competence protein ComEC [Pseudonocardiales bacterium]